MCLPHFPTQFPIRDVIQQKKSKLVLILSILDLPHYILAVQNSILAKCVQFKYTHNLVSYIVPRSELNVHTPTLPTTINLQDQFVHVCTYDVCSTHVRKCVHLWDRFLGQIAMNIQTSWLPWICVNRYMLKV